MALDKKGNAVCDLSLHDATDILLLNNTHAKETSALDDASLTALLDMAFYARGIDRGATALLIRQHSRKRLVVRRYETD